jgi:hypothetical protein
MSSVLVALGIVLLVACLVIFMGLAGPAYLELDHRVREFARANPGVRPSIWDELWLNRLTSEDRRRVKWLRSAIIKRSVILFGCLFAGVLCLALALLW